MIKNLTTSIGHSFGINLHLGQESNQSGKVDSQCK